MTVMYERPDGYPEGIIIKKFSNTVGAQEVLASWDNMFAKDLINDQSRGVIINLLNCDFKMNMGGFRRIIMYLKNKKIFKRVKIAVVSISPEVIVYPFIGQQQEKELNIRPFSSVDAAVQWIANEMA
tara:strand:+ start:42017 stop:42397 length:381 start_codon:yes stop_codon:yes gene_type:complete